MKEVHTSERLAAKTPQEAIIAQIQQDFNLTRIFAQAHFEQMERYFREHTALDLAHGQIAYEAVAVDEPAGKALKDCRRVMVKLQLVDHHELETMRLCGLAAVRQGRLLRLATEAHAQGGLLTVEDLAYITTSSKSTVKRDLSTLRETGVMVPTRGSLKDIGPGVSHKTQIVQLYLRGYQFTEIEMRTRHSTGSIKRYLSDFSHVIHLHLRDLSCDEIRMITGFSPSLINEYLALYERTKQEYPEAPRLQRLLAAQPRGGGKKGGHLS